MSDEADSSQISPDDGIELEPVVKTDIPRYVLKTEAERDQAQDAGGPVPAYPVHVCEHCDYDLRGLKSRICPECGEPFTLHSARRAGLIHDPTVQRGLTAAKHSRITLRVGIALFLLAWFLPLLNDFSTMQLFFSLARTLPILAFAFMYKVWAQTTWANVLLIAGIVAFCVEGICLFF